MNYLSRYVWLQYFLINNHQTTTNTMTTDTTTTTTWTTTTRKSPDNEEEPKRRQTRIIWAISESFLLFFVFLILTDVLLNIQVIIYILHDVESLGRRQQRQRAQTTPDACRLGHKWVYFFFFVFFYTNRYFSECTGYNLHSTRHWESRTATMMTESPNDARRTSFGP